MYLWGIEHLLVIALAARLLRAVRRDRRWPERSLSLAKITNLIPDVQQEKYNELRNSD
jgi:hypothetical protein